MLDGLIVLGIYLAIINSWSFIAMGIDKRRAQNRKRRIPEKTLWFFFIFGGSFGGLTGMKNFRHKTKHKQFVYGIPALLALHLVLFVIYAYIYM